jgi:hypothetical protein
MRFSIEMTSDTSRVNVDFLYQLNVGQLVKIS